MKKYSLLVAGLIVLFFASCDSEDDTPVVDPQGEEKEEESTTFDAQFGVIATTDLQSGTGFVVPLEELPDGDFDIASIGNGTQVSGSRNGGESYNGNIYLGYNTLGENGIQKYSIDDDGKLVNEGFIVASSADYNTNFKIVSDTKGYYFDAGRGLLKIQTFNPETMERTGEIDLSQLSRKDENSEITQELAGARMMTSKEGKLLVDIQYNATEFGFGDSAIDEINIAIIDIASDTYEKTMTLEGVQEVSYYPTNLNDYQIDASGTLYFNTMGNMLNGERNGKILRIRAGETEIDPDWSIDVNDYIEGDGIKWFLGGAAKIGNSIITYVKEVPFANDYSNFVEENMVLYAIDVDTKVATKVDTAPINDFNTINAPFVYEGKVWIPYSNSNGSGYYSYDGTSVNEELYLSNGIVQALFPL